MTVYNVGNNSLTTPKFGLITPKSRFMAALAFNGLAQNASGDQQNSGQQAANKPCVNPSFGRRAVGVIGSGLASGIFGAAVGKRFFGPLGAIVGGWGLGVLTAIGMKAATGYLRHGSS